MSPSPDPFRAEAVERISRLAGWPPEETDRALELPPRPEMGDLAFPCFGLSRLQKRPPAAIASDLASRLATEIAAAPGRLVRAGAAGPYVNIAYDRARFAQHVLREAVARGEGLGRSDEGAG